MDKNDDGKCGEKCIYGKLEFMDPYNKLDECDCCKWEYWGSQGPLYNMQHRYLGWKKTDKHENPVCW